MSNIRVLFVEDDLHTRLMIRKFLLNNSCDVYLASNGEEAIQTYIEKRIPIDVIVTDIMMPKLNGLELLMHVKQQPEYLNTTIIGITSGYLGYLESISTEKFDALLSKPLDMSYLLALIHKKVNPGAI